MRVGIFWKAALLLLPLSFRARPAPAQTTSFAPLTDMGAQKYLGFSGGLYPDGSNAIPTDHAAAGALRAASVQPLDRNGNPSSSGKIALVSIGMSNTTQEFCSAGGTPPCASWSFVGQALADPAVNHSSLVLVNGARGGQSADFWDSPTEPNYDRIRDTDLASAGLTEAQVQVAWVKVANPGPTRSLPASDADAYRLVTQMGNIVRALKVRYPNIRIVYLSSRIYGGYATTTLNPEPYAYESAFAVKWLIEAQMAQMRAGGTAVDPRAGDLNDNTVAPWIAWGPYLWANGLQPRSDSLTWQRSDLESDGTHPSQSGEQKVGAMLLSFLKNDPTSKAWFLASAAAPPQAIDTRILPVVGSTPGAFGSFFKTSAQIHNPSTSAIAGRFLYHPQGASGSDADPSLAYTLAPGETRTYADLLPAMGQSGLGTLDLLVTAVEAPVTVARIFNDAGVAGTSGFTEDILAPTDALKGGERGVVLVPADLVSFRMNVGVRTLGSGAAMTVTVRNAAGSTLRTVSKVYGPSYFAQISLGEFLGTSQQLSGNESLTFQISSGSAIVYGATVDNRTNDPSFQLARKAP